MFTGIIECLGKVVKIEKNKSNVNFTLQSSLSSELKIDQSLAHNGVCLTVVAVNPGQNTHTVTAIQETLQKSCLGELHLGSLVNLERATRLGDRLDGHLVQGHVDQTGVCIQKKEIDGSWVFTFEYSPNNGNITIEKGSIAVNGVSLTVCNSTKNSFEVAIIPYTYNHTNFSQIEVGTRVNLEFDMMGKYVKKLLSERFS